MAVIVKYIVVRNGEEKMTFATKKEADAYDKMLDIADNLFEFLDTLKIKLSDGQLEDISLKMAENRDDLIPILRGTKKKTAAAKKPAPAKQAAKKETKNPKGKSQKGKAQKSTSGKAKK